MTFAALLEELRAGKYFYAGSTSGGNADGHDISYITRDSRIYITFKGGVFFYDIEVQYSRERMPYTEAQSPRKMHQRQLYEAMKEGAKHHAHLH